MRDNAPAGSTVIRFARGRMTSMPPWLRVGLLVANGDNWQYVSPSPGAFPGNTTVTAIGPDTITISKPTRSALQGMVLGPSRSLEGRSSVGFYDSRRLKVGGVSMTPGNLAASLIEQAQYPFDVI